MLHHAPLLTTIATGLVAAFILGFIAQRLRLSPIVGYLAAGLLIGPYTPGFVGDVELATELSEIGVILLMFGVGLHFSFKELLAVRKVALPGAVVQMLFATALGTALGLALGWDVTGSVVFGLALSVASTVVMLRALEEHRMLDTRAGHIAIGWLIVEDLAMVLALVIVPVLANVSGGSGTSGGGDLSAGAIAAELGLTLVRVAAFVALMLIVGKRLIPWLLARAADTGSRELFTLGVLAIGMGVAVGAAWLFEVSFALGAFFAGMILRESQLAHRAAQDSLPLRDAFAVLFFVAVGMLVDPSIVVRKPVALAVTVVIIVVGKLAIAYLLVRLLRFGKPKALVVAASLAQIGEFSFILVTMGADLGLLTQDAQDLVLAGATLSIVINPMLFSWLSKAYTRTAVEADAPVTSAHGHVIVVGGGQVGVRAAESLAQRGVNTVTIDAEGDLVGDAMAQRALSSAGVDEAAGVIVDVADPLAAGAVVREVRRLSPLVPVIARGDDAEDVAHLRASGATAVVGEVEAVAERMASLATAVPPPDHS